MAAMSFLLQSAVCCIPVTDRLNRQATARVITLWQLPVDFATWMHTRPARYPACDPAGGDPSSVRSFISGATLRTRPASQLPA